MLGVIKPAFARDTTLITGRALSQRTIQYAQQFSKKQERYLHQLQRAEEKLYRKLARIDSAKAIVLLNNSRQEYALLNRKISQVPELLSPRELSNYLPGMDSIITSLKFLQHISPGNVSAATGLQQVQQVQAQLESATQIAQFVKEKRRYLQEQLAHTPLLKELKVLNKKVYYYNALVQEYKAAFKDVSKREQLLLAGLQKIPAFRRFMEEHSQLAALFPAPATGTSGLVNGLQTRQAVAQLLQSRVGSLGGGASVNTANTVNPAAFIQQQLGAAQAQMQQLQQRLQQALPASTVGDDFGMPNFKPNEQKTKTFWQRLELGTNMQTQRASSYFPTAADIGISIGYKLNSKSIVGFGTAYKLGLGTGFDNIRFSHQGLGLRSFVDWKLKGSFWVSGGFEMNYVAEFRRVDELKNFSAWKQNALLGLAKVVDVKSKFFKKTKVQLFYDFLWRQQLPQKHAVFFRVGYNF